MVTFRHYCTVSRWYTMSIITKPLISLLFGIIGGGGVVAGITITEALRVHHAAANSFNEALFHLNLIILAWPGSIVSFPWKMGKSQPSTALIYLLAGAVRETGETSMPLQSFHCFIQLLTLFNSQLT